jgi:hypothetical protein
MSQENEEIVRKSLEALNADLDAVADSRIVQLEGGGPFRGHDGVREWWRGLFSARSWHGGLHGRHPCSRGYPRQDPDARRVASAGITPSSCYCWRQ